MGTKTPTVWTDRTTGVARLEEGLPLDSAAWFTWLDAPTTTSFAYPVYDAAQGWIDSFLTVRKERKQRGGTYWTAYRHVGGRLRKVYLGRSPTITAARLAALAAALLANPDVRPFSSRSRGCVGRQVVTDDLTDGDTTPNRAAF